MHSITAGQMFPSPTLQNLRDMYGETLLLKTYSPAQNTTHRFALNQVQVVVIMGKFLFLTITRLLL